MGGGKPKKPLSALDKQRKKELRALRKVQREERKTLPSLIDDSLIRRAERTVKNLDLVTPSVLASALSIKVSVARKLIKMMIEKGVLNVIDKSRDLIIAVPSKGAAASSAAK